MSYKVVHEITTRAVAEQVQWPEMERNRNCRNGTGTELEPRKRPEFNGTGTTVPLSPAPHSPPTTLP